MTERLLWDRDGRDWPNKEYSSFVTAAGFQWHVQQMGRGPLMLLVHGLGASSHSWRKLAPLLAKAFRVVTLDLPGHGFTDLPQARRMSLPGMAAALNALLQELGATPVHGIGHSAGAAILARMCLDKVIAPTTLVSLNGALLPFNGVAHVFSPLAKLLFRTPFVPVPRFFAWMGKTAVPLSVCCAPPARRSIPRELTFIRNCSEIPAIWRGRSR